MPESFSTRRQSGTRADWLSSDRLIPLFFSIGFLFAMGGFVLQLSGADLSVDPAIGSGSMVSQSILGTFYTLGVILLLRTNIGINVFIRAWPIFLLPALAILSVLWSTWPTLTLRRGFALLGTLSFGLSLAATLGFRPCLRLVIRALTMALVLSVVCVLISPDYGVHQATDAIQAVHAGKWRGIFAHKNFLGGQVAALTLVLLIVYGRIGFENYFIRIGAIGLSVVCLVAADSSSGYAIAFVATLLGLSLSAVAVLPMEMRLSWLAVILGTLLLLSVFAEDIFGWTVALLGKSPNLTGRTEYWSYLLALMEGHWTIGYGYYAGFINISGTIATTLHTEGFGSTHNGYLDVLVSLGVVGLIFGLGYVLWLLLNGAKFILWGRAGLGALRSLPICVVAYVLMHNVTESSIMAGNTIIPLMLGVTTGMLVREKIIARAGITAATHHPHLAARKDR